MFKGLTQLTERDRLAARVIELEQQVTSLQKRLIRADSKTDFHRFASPVTLRGSLRDEVVSKVLDQFAPMFEPHFFRALKHLQAEISHVGSRFPQAVSGAMVVEGTAPLMQVQIRLPELVTSIRVAP